MKKGIHSYFASALECSPFFQLGQSLQCFVSQIGFLRLTMNMIVKRKGEQGKLTGKFAHLVIIYPH